MHFHMADQREPIIIGLKSVSLTYRRGLGCFKNSKDENQYNYQVKLP